MLTTEASNVLLKTLEEPPDHVVFILATTNREKIIPTILSRVVEVQFGLATKEELISALHRIVAGEKLQVPPETLELVAQKAKGSFRDATKLLEQLVVSNSLDLTEARIVLDGRDFTKVMENLVLAVNHKEALSAIQTLETALTSGISLGDLMTGFLEKLMQGLLGETTSFDKLNQTETTALVDLLLTAGVKAKDALLEQIPYEIALVKWADEYPQKREWQSLKETIKKTPIRTNIGLAKKILLQ
jgi:DNA polymerase-3 subunit gamma/tau